MGSIKLFKHINASLRCVSDPGSDSICNNDGTNSLNDTVGLSLTSRLGMSSNNLRNVFNAPMEAHSFVVVVVDDVIHCNINGINSTQFLIQNAFMLFSKCTAAVQHRAMQVDAVPRIPASVSVMQISNPNLISVAYCGGSSIRPLPPNGACKTRPSASRGVSLGSGGETNAFLSNRPAI